VLYAKEYAMSADRDTAIDAVDVLNDLVGDLVAGTSVFLDYRQRLKSGNFRVEQMSAVQKMCFSHLVLSFCKLLEFWERYQRLVPDTYRKDLKSLNAEIHRRGAKEFRNKVAGHIWDKKLQRPLRHSEIMVQLDGLIGKHADDFLYWVNNPESNMYPRTIVSVVETIRDAIAREHAIDPSEILKR
jgi:ribosomal protein S17E